MEFKRWPVYIHCYECYLKPGARWFQVQCAYIFGVKDTASCFFLLSLS